MRRGQDPAVAVCGKCLFCHLPAVPGRFVGAACMRPVNLPPPPVPGIIDALPGVCRGGIYASRQGCAPRGVPGSLPVSPTMRDKQRANHKRAATHRFGGRHGMRPLQCAINNAQTVNGRCRTFCGGRERPPYHAKQKTQHPAGAAHWWAMRDSPSRALKTVRRTVFARRDVRRRARAVRIPPRSTP